MKKVIRLTESDLIRIVKRVINEDEEDLGLPHPNKKEPYIKEEQFFTILNKLFNILYKKVKHKEDEANQRLSIYNGNKLIRYSKDLRNNTIIMDYYPKDESLWISMFIYSNIKRFFPQVSDNLLFLDFFKKWFSDKFGIMPKNVYITNERSLNDRYHNQQLNKTEPQ